MDSRMVGQTSGVLMIFDLDGTLFRSESVTVPAVQSTFEDFALPPPPEDEIRSYFGRPHSDFQTWLNTIIPSDRSSEIISEIDRRELLNVAACGRLYDGVPDVLEKLISWGMELALCTNGEESYVSAVIDGHDLRRRFNRIRYRKSPADTKATMAGEIVSRTEFNYGFFMGDRSDDMNAAKLNGLFAIGAEYGFGSDTELGDADIVLSDIALLPAAVVRRISNSYYGKSSRR